MSKSSYKQHRSSHQTFNRNQTLQQISLPIKTSSFTLSQPTIPTADAGAHHPPLAAGDLSLEVSSTAVHCFDSPEMNSAAAVGCRPPFTASQWEELEHQALIYKYMISGSPVPSELVLPIRRSLASLPSRLYHHPTLGYCTYYGKKLDPEPGRCRRTDGKKWRCSKDAHPDSKYCERHMHRSRSRSRKPVESQALSQSQSTLSTVTSLTPAAGSGGVSGSRGIAGSFQHNPLQSSVAGGSSLLGSCNAGASASQLNIDLGSYAMSNKEYRYLCGVKAQADGHSFFSEGSGSERGLRMHSSLESSWRQIPSRVSSFPLSRERTSSVMPSSYPQLQSVQDLEQAAISSLSKPPQHYSFSGCDFASETGKVESHSLHPFFDEWPKTKDSWTGLEDERSNRTSFSTTQLSISIPMASADFSTTSSRSPNDD